MSSQWTNKYAIMRDLSMAQGCVPVDVDKTVTANQKPPIPLITEDTEEEFFKHCVGGGDFNAPDLGLIKQMLDLVRDSKLSSDSEAEEENVLQISKLKPTAHEYVSQKNVDPNLSPVVTNVKPALKIKESLFFRKSKQNNKRNVAVTSILESIAKSRPKDKQDSKDKIEKSQDLTTLLKSNEPHQSRTVTNSVKKVSSWLDSNQKEKVKKTPLLVDPSSMFKRKANVSPPKQVKESIKSPPNVSTNYKPSLQANEYYKKYVEKSQLKQQISEDIWAKAEREMKEIDAKRKQEEELSMQESPCSTLTISEVELSNGSPVALSDARLDIVKLPKHRHLLTGECVVCKVLCEKTFRETIKIRKMQLQGLCKDDAMNVEKICA